ncbi:hypothetical protein H671_1g3989 [Cricetulus griseus]|nr:hypothetical protein H671_1g3989 [Cricetulus griseus]
MRLISVYPVSFTECAEEKKTMPSPVPGVHTFYSADISENLFCEHTVYLGLNVIFMTIITSYVLHNQTRIILLSSKKGMTASLIFGVLPSGICSLQHEGEEHRVESFHEMLIAKFENALHHFPPEFSGQKMS